MATAIIICSVVLGVIALFFAELYVVYRIAFYSPDKTELWMCHHCLDASNPKQTPMTRRVHVQKVLFDKTGFPHLGLPVPKGIKLKQPLQ
jgi:hypothetical protein